MREPTVGEALDNYTKLASDHVDRLRQLKGALSGAYLKEPVSRFPHFE